MRFAIIGAGMSGILASIKLSEAGHDDQVIYEKADRLGGTWRENTYPGIACDVPSHLYSYSFAPNPGWSHQFSPGDEIEGYFERVADDYGVTPRIRFGEEVTRTEWRDGRWHLETGAGRSDEADVVIAATGVLHHPRMPDIEGLGTFAGPCFHSARWNHDVDLAGKRVGVIGTGSTAVQIISAIVDEVGHLDVFQRTPPWIFPVQNTAYSEEELAAFREHPERLTQLHDTLAELFSGFAAAVTEADSVQNQSIATACVANLENSVADPELRERLRPDYQPACKRLIMSGDYYEAIQKPNAEVVTEGIECVVPEGVRTKDGELHELDVLICATGFKADAFMRPMDIVGRGGVTLAEAWDPRPNAYLSISLPEFPNLFMLNGPNGPVGNFSLIEVAELQMAYSMGLIDELAAGRGTEICATQEAMDAHEEARVAEMSHTIWVTGCSSWYLDDRGIPATWPWPFEEFRAAMAARDLAAYDLR